MTHLIEQEFTSTLIASHIMKVAPTTHLASSGLHYGWPCSHQCIGSCVHYLAHPTHTVSTTKHPAWSIFGSCSIFFFGEQGLSQATSLQAGKLENKRTHPHSPSLKYTHSNLPFSFRFSTSHAVLPLTPLSPLGLVLIYPSVILLSVFHNGHDGK